MIMISSACREGDMERCRQLGIGRYLMKPIIQSELLDAMLELFGAVVLDESDEDPIVGPRLRVLLAEDGLINQQVAVGLLRHFGHDVVVVNNGKQAVEAIEQDAFDVVLMDVQMPEMDGHAATAAIRSFEKGLSRYTPIVAMTAAAMKGDRERCLESGMDGYLAKPIDPDELSNMLVQFTPGSGWTDSQRDPPTETEDRRDNAVSDPEIADFVDMAAAMDLVPGGIEGFRRFARTVLAECFEMMNEIRNGLAQHDPRRLQRGAHTLKSIAGYFRARRVVNIAQRIETMGRDEDLVGAERNLPELEFEVDRLCEAIKSATHLRTELG
jgi:CheY-like chemotaxis protein